MCFSGMLPDGAGLIFKKLVQLKRSAKLNCSLLGQAKFGFEAGFVLHPDIVDGCGCSEGVALVNFLITLTG